MIKILLLATAAVVVAVTSAATDSEWAVFKATHNKTHYHKDEESVRRLIWEENLKRIATHNELYAKKLTSFYLGENQFADMTNVEFSKMMNGFGGLRENDSRPMKYEDPKHNTSLPAEVNWITQGYVTPVKNQGQCGSCWSFSSSGALEGANYKKTGRLVSLSEKNLMDCTWSYGNKGCGGGWMDHAFQYVITNRGIDTEQGYPYYPRSDYTCRYNRAYNGGYAVSFTDVPKGSEAGLQQASASVGPVSVAIDATHYSFQLYRGGIYNEPKCSSTALDHAVLVVGYGTYYGKDYWLVKNSWGTYWGEAGYIRMTRNKNNQCGIASMASYPIA